MSCEKKQTKGSLSESIAQLTADERLWMDKFFQDVMLDESAIYTLWGSKPITTIILNHISDEEINAWVEGMSEEEKKELIISTRPYDLPENWKKWEKIRTRFSIPQYLFFKRSRSNDVRFEDIYFVNILQTALTLQQHYAIFKKYTGNDFDPLKVVFEIENEDSTFWKKALNHSLLLGILFGFGLENSSCFDWKYFTDTEDNPEMEAFITSLPFRFDENAKDFADPSIHHFALPPFASFSYGEKDEIIEKYKKMRDEIKTKYKGKNFLDTTIERLTGNES